MIAKFAVLLMVTIVQITTVSRDYDGKHVDVTGRAMHSRVAHLADGAAYVQFALCAQRCIHVVVLGTPAIAAGQTITVHGTFYSHKDLGGFVLHGIEADPGSL